MNVVIIRMLVTFAWLRCFAYASIPRPRSTLAAIYNSAVHISETSKLQRGRYSSDGGGDSGRNSADWKFAELSKSSRTPWSTNYSTLKSMPYQPIPMDDQESRVFFISEEELAARQRAKEQQRQYYHFNNNDIENDHIRKVDRNGGNKYERASSTRFSPRTNSNSNSNSWQLFGVNNMLPKVNFRCDPLINFKLKQKLVMLGACITLGLDYLSDIGQWRSYCSVEDRIMKGRFSLRGQEIGWAKSWLINLGLGEEQSAKLKLRLGLNLRSHRAYAKLRFRTEPISPFDLGEGLSCAGKVPLPLHVFPALKYIPLRVEYLLRLNTVTQRQQQQKQQQFQNNKPNGATFQQQRAFLVSGISAVDVSLDELNFCLEWDEKSPVWGLGIVKSAPSRRADYVRNYLSPSTATTAAAAANEH